METRSINNALRRDQRSRAEWLTADKWLTEEDIAIAAFEAGLSEWAHIELKIGKTA